MAVQSLLVGVLSAAIALVGMTMLDQVGSSQALAIVALAAAAGSTCMMIGQD